MSKFPVLYRRSILVLYYMNMTVCKCQPQFPNLSLPNTSGSIGFPGDSVVKDPPAMQETRVRSLGWEDLLEKEMTIQSSIFARKSHGQRSLVGCNSWGLKESDTTEWLSTQACTELYCSQLWPVLKVFDSTVKERWSRKTEIWGGGGGGRKGRGFQLTITRLDWISLSSMGLEESLA